jgi:hypothetical protein
VKAKIRRQLNRCKRRIEHQLDKFNLEGCERPMFTASNIRYKMSDRDRGIAHGGIGAIHALARRTGLIEPIDRHLALFKIHLPYHEPDNVLNFAYNALCEGTCLEDIERRRNDEVFLDALGARRISDPTTAGDFAGAFVATPTSARCSMRSTKPVRRCGHSNRTRSSRSRTALLQGKTVGFIRLKSHL